MTAYRAALEERTRERVPLDWAATQMTSATRSRRWGSARGGRARLKEAVIAFRAALEERHARAGAAGRGLFPQQKPGGLALAALGDTPK